MPGTLPFPIKREIDLSSNITADEAVADGMENVAGAAGRMAEVLGRCPDQLLRMVFEVVKVDSLRLVNHWKRLLAPKSRQNLALDVLGEIKIRADEARQGKGIPIAKPGAWFVSEFYKRAGISRPARAAK